MCTPMWFSQQYRVEGRRSAFAASHPAASSATVGISAGAWYVPFRNSSSRFESASFASRYVLYVSQRRLPSGP
jgi:hypothetical protein